MRASDGAGTIAPEIAPLPRRVATRYGLTPRFSTAPDRWLPERSLTAMATDSQPMLLITVDRVHARPGARAPSADAVLVRADRVVAIGAAADLEPLAGGARRLDLPGLTLTPGLTDAHVHLVEWALSRLAVDLTTTDSAEAAAHRVAEHAGRGSGSGWVVGRGWDPHRWGASPHRRHLDEALPGRPVLLHSHDMHSAWASTVALRAAGVTRDTPEPAGGRIERDPDGEPTGVLRDNAVPLLTGAAPAPAAEERRAALLEGQRALHRVGVSGVHTVEPESLGLLEDLRAADQLRLRVLQHLPLAKLDDAIRLGLRSGFGGPWLRIGGVKMFLDGALGSRTAWMREPYEGTTADRGMSTLPPDEFRDAVRRGSAAGLATTVHAIGDAATDLALDVLHADGAALTGRVPHRIEHAQLVRRDRLGPSPHPALRSVVCSVQPSHLMTDWRAADRHWGPRAGDAYPFRSLEVAGATLAFGSDAPVEPPDPRQGLYAAVSRRDLAGEPGGGWFAEERLSPVRALAGYTTGAARAAGDARQGRLDPGTFADLVAWDRDPLSVEPEALLEMRAVVTVVGGEVVWSDG